MERMTFKQAYIGHEGKWVCLCDYDEIEQKGTPVYFDCIERLCSFYRGSIVKPVIDPRLKAGEDFSLWDLVD